MDKAKPLSRTLGACVGVVALPLQPAVAQLEAQLAQQVHRLGALGRTLHGGAEGDVPDFDAAVVGHDRHQAQDALGLAAGAVDDGVEQRVAASGVTFQPTVEGGTFGEWAIREVVPQHRVGRRALQHLPEVFAMARRVELFQADEAAVDGLGLGGCGGFPVQCVGHVRFRTLCGIG